MTEIKRLRLPLDENSVRELRAGDVVTLDGEVTITAGLPTHQRMLDCIQSGEPLPLDMGGVLLHLGGYSRLNGDEFELLYVNPTTSTRFEHFMPTLIKGLGLRVVGGKGGLGPASVTALQQEGCVYLSFIGGGCTILSHAIRKVVKVGWPDMLIHYRLTKLEVEGLGPCTVGIDAHGNSLYDQGQQTARKRMPDILRALDEARGPTG